MECLQLLRDLIAIPSLNPMGRSVTGEMWYESRLGQFLVDYFRRHNIASERHEVQPGRDNILARLPGSPGAPTILLDAHQDTVPVDHMTIEPFRAEIHEGRLYGRGACDVKGAMAAMLTALVRFAQDPLATRATVVMACTVDEEFHEQGVLAILEKLKQAVASADDLFHQPPTMAIVAEPTELHVAVAHRGATRWKIRTHGRAAHSSDPTQGINAIYRMARVVTLLQDYAAALQAESIPHPLCGGATLSVGRIDGGTSVNIVPDCCTVEIDRRVSPGEDGSQVIHDVDQFLRPRLEFAYESLPPWTVGVPLSDADNQPLALQLLAASAGVIPGRQRIGVPFGTHAARYASAGIPSVVCGPGSIAQAHTADEWIAVEQVEQAAEVYYRFLRSVA
jgi:acetylornithine deacetylase